MLSPTCAVATAAGAAAGLSATDTDDDGDGDADDGLGEGSGDDDAAGLGVLLGAALADALLTEPAGVVPAVSWLSPLEPIRISVHRQQPATMRAR
ncbi:hypothetical protein AB0K51_09635 [Kitasatospora sp. NPDC049285]|uniref:hypothetical protein n=1 Tax=Kitasatospora sp. NPDC049285 TaxID=3157096 RepID=UPI003423169B